jgi:hypothetical protein
VALGRRLARADMAAGVDTWSSSAAMSVAGIRMEAVRPAQQGQSRNLLRDKQREVECDLPAEGVADDVQAAVRPGYLGGEPGSQRALSVASITVRGDCRRQDCP